MCRRKGLSWLSISKEKAGLLSVELSAWMA